MRGSGWIGQYDLMGLRQFQPGGKVKWRLELERKNSQSSVR